MRIGAVSNYNLARKNNQVIGRKSSVKSEGQDITEVNFKGIKGALIGALYGIALAPATLGGSLVAGPLLGHAIEEHSKKDEPDNSQIGK